MVVVVVLGVCIDVRACVSQSHVILLLKVLLLTLGAVCCSFTVEREFRVAERGCDVGGECWCCNIGVEQFFRFVCYWCYVASRCDCFWHFLS